ncbi:MAG: lysylphosphatidylglycerol synthase transmembrane domain-containing protein [Chloroflexota bacterium]
MQLLCGPSGGASCRPDGPTVRGVLARSAVPALLIGTFGTGAPGAPGRAAPVPAIVARRERLDFAVCFGATVIERVVDTATLAIVAFLAAATLGVALSIVAMTAAAATAGLVVIGLLVTIGLTGITTVVARRVDRWMRSARVDALADRMVAFARGVDRGRSPRRLVAAAAVSCVCWALDALVFWLVAQAIGATLSFPQAVLIGAVTVLVTAIPAAPGYVGTYELAATGAATALGIPGAEALGVALLAHVLTTLPLAIGGCLALVTTGARLVLPSTPQRWTEVPAPMASQRLDIAGQP